MDQVPAAHPRAPALVTAALGLVLSATAFCGVLDAGVKDCPNSPSRLPVGETSRHALLEAYDAFDALLPPPAAPRQLLPGTRRVTPGVPMSGHLAGVTIVTESVPFSFLAKNGLVVTGTLNTDVVDAPDCTCDFYWWVHLAADSALGIDQVIIQNFPHPDHQLYAAWRNDELPLGIPPDHARRSPGAGTTITFSIAAVVQPGQDSRSMLLDSAVGFAQKTATVQIRATDGSLSAPILTWAPKWP